MKKLILAMIVGLFFISCGNSGQKSTSQEEEVIIEKSFVDSVDKKTEEIQKSAEELNKEIDELIQE